MVWINYIHLNIPAPPGAFGGSVCMYPECCSKRAPQPEKDAIEIMQEAQLPINDDKPRCERCGKVLEKYYHDAGDHFSAGTAPGSEWRFRTCNCLAEPRRREDEAVTDDDDLEMWRPGHEL